LTATSVGTPSWTPRSSRPAPAQTLAPEIVETGAGADPGRELGPWSAAGAGEERHGARRSRVDLDHVDCVLLDRKLNIDESAHVEGEGEQPYLAPQLGLQLERETHRRRDRG
jgi:hypothetical protein